MLWIRYKHKFSYGNDKEWTYRPLYRTQRPSKEHFQELILEPICDEFSHSEHYRGIDYDIIEQSEVPENVIRSVVDSLNREIRSLQVSIEKILTDQSS